MAGERTQPGSVYDVILRQHLDFRRICSDIEQGKDVRQNLSDLRDYITGHERAEEDLVFADLMRSDPKLRELSFEMAAEHHACDVLLDELTDMQPDGDTFKATAQVFKEVVEDHLNEEESKYWTKAQSAKDEQWAQQVAWQFQQDEQKHAGETQVALPGFA